MLLVSIVVVGSLAASLGPRSYPCGVPGAREVLAFATPRDPLQVVEIERNFEIAVAHEKQGPVEVSDTATGRVLMSLPSDEYDLWRGGRRDDGKVVHIRTHKGTLFVDSRAMRKWNGAWIYFCWKPDHLERPAQHREEYFGLDIDSDGISATIERVDGSSLRAPQIQNQVHIDQPRTSTDRRTLGWLVTTPLSTAFFPTDLVIFREGKIWLDIGGDDDAQFLGGWTFVRGGAAVAYSTTYRFGDFQMFHLVDLESGLELETFLYPDSDDEQDGPQKRAAAISEAPDWVRQTSRRED